MVTNVRMTIIILWLPACWTSLTKQIYRLHTAKKDFYLTIVFLARIATVDMVLWDDTRIPCDNHLWEMKCTSYRNN